MSPLRIALLAVVFALGGVQAAVCAQSTRPATTQVGQALPRGNHPTQLLVDYAVAMALGQEKIIHDCYIINTPEEEQMVQGYMAMSRSLAHLRAVADRRWQGGFENIGFQKLLEEDRDKIVYAKVEFSADKKHATVSPERSSPIQLGLVGGQWRILTGASHSNIPRRLIYLRAQIGAYDELASQIEAGKFSLPIEAQVAGFKLVKEAREAARKKTEE